MAMDVLKKCQEGGRGRGSGTGGANVFEGNWRVSVSRELVVSASNPAFGAGLGFRDGDDDGRLRGEGGGKMNGWTETYLCVEVVV